VQHRRSSANNALRKIGVKNAERDRSAFDGFNRQNRPKIGQITNGKALGAKKKSPRLFGNWAATGANLSTGIRIRAEYHTDAARWPIPNTTNRINEISEGRQKILIACNDQAVARAHDFCDKAMDRATIVIRPI
jgi:hypothetical protein